MTKEYECYKVTGYQFSPKRRETLQGAMKLADKLHKEKKHGRVEGVTFCDEHGNFKFVLIREF